MNINKKLKLRKHHILFIINYILIFMFIISIVFVFVYISFAHSAVNTAITERKKKLDQIGYSLDNLLAPVYELSAHLASDSDISSWLHKNSLSEEDYFELYEINKKISKINDTYDNIHSIYIYNNRKSKFISNILGYKDAVEIPFRGWEYGFAEDISYYTAMNTVDVELDGSSVDTISFIRSAPTGKNNGAIIINIKESLFSKYVKVEDDELIMIIDEFGKVISNSDKSMLSKSVLDQDYIQRIYKDPKIKVFETVVNGKKGIVAHNKLNSNDFRIIYYIPDYVLDSYSIEYKKQLYIAVFFCFVFGILAAYFMSGKTYNKIDELFDNISGHTKYDNLDLDNEIYYLQQLFENLKKEKNFYERKYSQNYTSIKDSQVRKLIYGISNNLDLLYEVGLLDKTIKSNFIIASIEIEEADDNFDSKKISDFFSNSYNKHILKTDVNVYTVVLVCKNNNLNSYAIEDVFGKIINNLIEKYIVTVGVSSVYSNPKYISRMYKEASIALKHKFLSGKNSVILFDKIKYNKKNIVVNKDKFYAFKLLLTQKKYLEIEKYIDKMIDDEISSSSIGDINLTLNSLFAIVLDEIPKNNETQKLIKKEEYAEFFNKDTLAEKKIVLFNLVKKYVHYKEKSKTKKTDDMIKDIIEFIDSNYNNNISLSVLSDDFHLSTSHLSTLLKEKLGVSFVDYLNELRVEKSIELLKDSQLKLKTVAFEVGYENVHTYIRNFKKFRNTTPAKYRAEHF